MPAVNRSIALFIAGVIPAWIWKGNLTVAFCRDVAFLAAASRTGAARRMSAAVLIGGTWSPGASSGDTIPTLKLGNARQVFAQFALDPTEHTLA